MPRCRRRSGSRLPLQHFFRGCRIALRIRPNRRPAVRASATHAPVSEVTLSLNVDEGIDAIGSDLDRTTPNASRFRSPSRRGPSAPCRRRRPAPSHAAPWSPSAPTRSSRAPSPSGSHGSSASTSRDAGSKKRPNGTGLPAAMSARHDAFVGASMRLLTRKSAIPVGVSPIAARIRTEISSASSS